MYSRRTFLIGLFVFTPMVLAPTGLLNGIQLISYKKRRGRFVKEGWLLQEGDV
jgi:hypothetical protein